MKTGQPLNAPSNPNRGQDLAVMMADSQAPAQVINIGYLSACLIFLLGLLQIPAVLPVAHYQELHIYEKAL